jgi:hypothetical protein
MSCLFRQQIAAVLKTLRIRGLSYCLLRAFPYVTRTMWSLVAYMAYYRKLARYFIFNGKSYRYFYHYYNTTWNNSRCVEVPIAYQYIRDCPGRALEFGNVLPHYFAFWHDVVDKYERWPGVVNCDIVDFEGEEPYDLIVSIGTLEHVGRDEPLREHGKVAKALRSLIRNCRVGGAIVATFPIGYNLETDELISRAAFDETYFLRRSKDGWAQTSLEEALGLRYDFEKNVEGAVFIGVIRVTDDLAQRAER